MLKLIATTRTKRKPQTAIDLDLVKSYLKIDNNDENDLLAILIDAAVQAFEAHTQIVICESEYLSHFRDFKGLELPLNKRPINQILAVYLTDFQGVVTALHKAHYYLGDDRLMFKNYHRFRDVYVEFSAGAFELSSQIKAVLLKHIAFLYENRESDSEFDLKHYQHFFNYKL